MDKNSNKNFDDKKSLTKGVLKTRSGLMRVDKTVQFMDAFYANGGNATEAAMQVFDCSSRATAANIGRTYLEMARKRGLVASFMENANISYGDLIAHAFEKMKQSKNPAWWDRLMREAGYARAEVEVAQKKNNQPTSVSVNVYQAHKQMADEYIDGEVVQENETELLDE